MAKSVGNITSLADALAEHGRDAVIMFLVAGHYRQPIQFDATTMAQAAANVRRVREAARRLAPGPSPPEMGQFKERFFDALADDFNTPIARRRVRLDQGGQPPRSGHGRRRPARDARDPRARQPARRGGRRRRAF
jgi:cysteinyl-tRNA synthetase